MLPGPILSAQIERRRTACCVHSSDKSDGHLRQTAEGKVAPQCVKPYRFWSKRGLVSRVMRTGLQIIDRVQVSVLEVLKHRTVKIIAPDLVTVMN
jgi:hypothetical protein